METRFSGNGAYYIRASSDKQDTERQRLSISKWLKANDLEVRPFFCFADEDLERDRPELRPEFQKMIKAAQEGLIKWIVVDAQDRFGTKDKHQFIYYMHLLREAGCDLWTIDGKCLTDDSFVAFIEGGLGADTSQKEQREKSHRVLTGKIVKARRGEWQGGHVAFGMDVACIGPDGKERWRVVIEGRELVGTKPGRGGRQSRIYSIRRTKILLDGGTESYCGNQNFPATDANEQLQLRPSQSESRLAIVREIFRRYADEALCPTQVAAWLNKLGITHHYADRWAHYHVRDMLKNPIYTGYQRWNSNGQGRFNEFIGGHEKPVQKAVGRRERTKADWILSDQQLFESVVPMHIWERVQAKLARTAPKRREPRSSDLWFTGLLFCNHCGKPMRGMKRPSRSEYFCSTYSSTKGECSCLRHTVNHTVVEEYITRYLKEAGQEAALLLTAQTTGNFEVLRPHHDKHRANLMRFCFALGRTVDAVTSQPDWERVLREYTGRSTKKSPPRTLEEFHANMAASLVPLEKAYQLYFQRDEVEIRKTLDNLEDQHTTLTDQILNLDPAKAKRAIEKANDRLFILEQEIERTKSRLKNWSEELERIREETCSHVTALSAAEDLLADPASDNRRKAQAVRSCIDRINLTFRPTGKKYPKSELVNVEIVPHIPPNGKHPNSASY